MKRSITNFINYGMCMVLIFACLSCGSSVNNEYKSTNNLTPTPALTNPFLVDTSKSPAPTNTGAVPEPSPSPAICERIKQCLDRITELLNATETQVKREVMSSREREEDEQIRRISPPGSGLKPTSNACTYLAFPLDNGRLKIMTTCALKVRTMDANVRDLDAGKIKDTGKSIIIPCKARSGDCVTESMLPGRMGKTEYTKSATLTINLTNFTGGNIPTKLVNLFSALIKLAQANPT